MKNILIYVVTGLMLSQYLKFCAGSGPVDIKPFIALNSAKHEIFSADQYEIVKECWYFHIHKHRKCHIQLSWARKQLYLSIICSLLAGKISCSSEH